MGLLNPGALWLLLLPAAWLLLGRNRTARTRRQVGNLYLWSQPAAAAPAQLALRNIRRHWVVLLQAAIMTVVVVALARPTFSWETRHVALVIDVSASMAAREDQSTRIDRAKEAARSKILGFPRGTRVRLITAGRSATDLGEFTADDPGLRRALDAIVASAGSADVPRAIRTARATGAAPDDIHVFSDSSEAIAGAGGAQWVRVGSALGNRAITALAGRRLPESPASGQVVATVWNYSPQATDADVEILQRGSVVARRRLRLEPGRARTIAVDVTDAGGVVQARLTGTGDALPADDQRLTVIPEATVARVLLLTRGHFFLEQALTVNPAVSLEIAPAGLDSAGADVDVVVCDRCENIPQVGRAVLMIPVLRRGSPAPVTVSLPQHPIAAALEHVGAWAAAAEGPSVLDGGEIVLRAGGRPALIAHERNGRKIVELRLDLLEGGFPLSTAFPVVLDNVLAWLVGRSAEANILAGDVFRTRLRTTVPSVVVSIVGPDGAPVRTSVDGGILTTTDTLAAGAYEIRGDGATRPFTVNPVTDGESDLSRHGEPASDSIDPSAGATTAASEQAPLLILLACGLLMLEWHARTGERQGA